MSAFDRFEFGFPLPGMGYQPDEGEFLIVGKVGHRNRGPYLANTEEGRKYLELHTAHGCTPPTATPTARAGTTTPPRGWDGWPRGRSCSTC